VSAGVAVVLASSRLISYLAETGNPSSPPAQGVPDVQVTPGWVGFVAIFVVAVATVFLIVDMTRRIRRVRYRAEVREQIELEREEAAREAAGLDDELREQDRRDD
jgi:hypothetical protein